MQRGRGCASTSLSSLRLRAGRCVEAARLVGAASRFQGLGAVRDYFEGGVFDRMVQFTRRSAPARKPRSSAAGSLSLDEAAATAFAIADDPE